MSNRAIRWTGIASCVLAYIIIEFVQYGPEQYRTFLIWLMVPTLLLALACAVRLESQD